jgi:hypothetical protein
MKLLKWRKWRFLTINIKILRVHQRNMVHARYLQNNLNTLEANCNRNLNKVQQEIYNVYYSEFLPLKESKRKIDKQHTVTRQRNKKYGLAALNQLLYIDQKTSFDCLCLFKLIHITS